MLTGGQLYCDEYRLWLKSLQSVAGRDGHVADLVEDFISHQKAVLFGIDRMCFHLDNEMLCEGQNSGKPL